MHDDFYKTKWLSEGQSQNTWVEIEKFRKEINVSMILKAFSIYLIKCPTKSSCCRNRKLFAAEIIDEKKLLQQSNENKPVFFSEQKEQCTKMCVCARAQTHSIIKQPKAFWRKRIVVSLWSTNCHLTKCRLAKRRLTFRKITFYSHHLSNRQARPNPELECHW